MKITDGKIKAKVISSKGDKKYEVRSAGPGIWTCTCPAYRYTRGRVGTKRCKHILMAWKDGFATK